MSRFQNIIFFSISLILLTYTFFIGLKNVFRYNKLRVQHEKTLNRYQLELAKKENFEKQLEQMKQNTYWELQAKQKLSYVKPGEVVYKLAK